MITPRHFHDQQLAERYLADQLAPQEQAELEEYYSDHPEVLRDLQAVAGIKIGLASLRAGDELERLTTPARTSRRLGLALAASLLIATTGSGLWWRAQLPPGTLRAAAPVLTAAADAQRPVVATYDVQHTRSEVDVIIAKPATLGAIRLRWREELDPPPARYRLELNKILPDDTRQPFAQLGALMVDEQRSLNVYVDPHLLELGRYELRLLKDGAAVQASVGDFLLDVVADAALPQAPTTSR